MGELTVVYIGALGMLAIIFITTLHSPQGATTLRFSLLRVRCTVFPIAQIVSPREAAVAAMMTVVVSITISAIVLCSSWSTKIPLRACLRRYHSQPSQRQAAMPLLHVSLILQA